MTEVKFRCLVEHSLTGVYLIQDNVFRYVNPQLAKIFGYSPGDIIEKKGPDDLVYPEDRAVVRENIRKRLDGEIESVNYEFRAVKKNGEIFYIEVFGARTVYNGRPAVIGTLLDITERKRSEDKGRIMLDNVMMGITMINPKMEVIWINRVIKKRFPAIDIRKKPLCYQSFYSPPRKKICDYCPTIEAFNTGGIHSSETGVCADGKIYNVIATPVENEKGKISYVVETVEDITERKQADKLLKESEKKYRDLVDNALVGIYKTGLKGDFLYVNEALSKMFEYESPEEMRRHDILKLYKNPGDRELLIESLKKTGKVNNFKVELLTKTGKHKNILLSASLDGETISVMVMDITERLKLEDALKERVKELEEFYDMAVGRELKMVELKEEIESLREKPGK